MDFTTIGFYGAICGALAAAAPYVGGLWLRIVLGGAVGVVASWVLPGLRGMIGLY